MSAVRAPNSIQFPNEAEILKYADTHPMTITGIRTNLCVPNVFEAVAKFFSERRIEMNQLSGLVVEAVGSAIDASDNEDVKALNRMTKGIIAMDDFSLVVGTASATEIILVTHAKVESFLKDLLEGATFIKNSGSGKWERSVKQLATA